MTYTDQVALDTESGIKAFNKIFVTEKIFLKVLNNERDFRRA